LIRTCDAVTRHEPAVEPLASMDEISELEVERRERLSGWAPIAAAGHGMSDEDSGERGKRAPKGRRTPHTKRRDVNLLQGDAGEKLVAAAMPEQWLVRKLESDFGIDLHVEVFDWAKDDPTAADTLGEHFFIQVKSQKELQTVTHTVRSRGNVAKYVPDPKEGDAYNINVIPCALEVGELMTIEAMGNAVPVLLCVVGMDTRTVYYMCMNDYISKVLLPNKPDYTKQKTVTVHLPAWNVLDRYDDGIGYLWLLARRAKFYSAFNTFAYQGNEFEYTRDRLLSLAERAEDEVVRFPDDLIAMLDVFLTSNLRLDIWQPAGPALWAPLGDVASDFRKLQATLPGLREEMTAHELTIWIFTISQVFNRAANLGRMYEELAREWRLPTQLATMLDDHPALKYRPTARPLTPKETDGRGLR